MDNSLRIKTFEDLINLFKTNQFPFSVDPINLIIETPSRAMPLPGNLYYKWNTTAPFLQIVHYMMDEVPAARAAELHTAITRLNLVIECPCVGYDHNTNRLYFRITVPVFPDDGVAAGTLEKLTVGCIASAKEYLPVFAQIIAGRSGADVEKILVEIKNSPSDA